MGGCEHKTRYHIFDVAGNEPSDRLLGTLPSPQVETQQSWPRSPPSVDLRKVKQFYPFLTKDVCVLCWYH